VKAARIFLAITLSVLAQIVGGAIRNATAPTPTPELAAQTKALPAWQIDENLAGYEELAKREPENEL